MEAVTAFMVIVFLAVMVLPFAGVKWKGMITIMGVSLAALVSSFVAVRAMMGTNIEYVFAGSLVTGRIPVRVDALSGWFILVINFTFITGAIYGVQYMKTYQAQSANLSLHWISYILAHASLLSICLLQNTIAFLIAWEIMALSSFLLIIFEHHKRETLNAGINFLIQSHVGVMLLIFGFVWVALKMNSYDLHAISLFASSNSLLTGVALFFCFFTGFAIKAGFVPFHTWLPYAHPAAPAHVSGVMSGVIIKIGIYGILRMLLLIKSDYTFIGYAILFLSLVSGIYGVMLAIIQHNLKRLLAYHSIENIGIIGIGIGLGCIGIGRGNSLLVVLGFGGALLHTLNHSLFKSVLFYGAGSVYQATHTMDIERLGGLVKRMPHTTFLFLIAALAICGLPPFNGFISEFLIYSGMFEGLKNKDIGFLSVIVSSLFALALIGGLAMLCFTKAFGSVFLGTPRRLFPSPIQDPAPGKLAAMYAGVALIIAIGLLPQFFVSALAAPINLFLPGHDLNVHSSPLGITRTLSMIGLCSAGFIALAGLIFFTRIRLINRRSVRFDSTWGCGYDSPTDKMQYTGSSFTRAYRKLAEPLLSIRKKKKEVTGIFPRNGLQETHPYDKSELWLIDYPLIQLKKFFNLFTFLQNGNLQFYILYGIVFITLVLGIPIVYEQVKSFVQFLNHL